MALQGDQITALLFKKCAGKRVFDGTGTGQNMTPELYALALAGLLQVIQFILYAITSNMQVGPKYAAGPRDETRELTGTAGRLQRALNNHYEGLILFTLAVVVVTFSDQSTWVTAGCAHLYLIARVLYVPAYVSGIPYLRSAIWAVGLFATIAMLIAALV